MENGLRELISIKMKIKYNELQRNSNHVWNNYKNLSYNNENASFFMVDMDINLDKSHKNKKNPVYL